MRARTQPSQGSPIKKEGKGVKREQNSGVNLTSKTQSYRCVHVTVCMFSCVCVSFLMNF